MLVLDCLAELRWDHVTYKCFEDGSIPSLTDLRGSVSSAVRSFFPLSYSEYVNAGCYPIISLLPPMLVLLALKGMNLKGEGQ